jgi:Xaa-Pro dipeptidase
MIKSPQEIEYIRQAARAATAGLAKGIEAIAPGRTENEIAAAVYSGMLLAGSEYPASPPYVASGPRSGLAHATWAGRVIEQGDPIYFEVGGEIRRYGGSHMRMASAGRPDPEVVRRCEVVAEALTNAIAAIKPGATSGEVDAACRSTFERAGYGPLFRHRTGYSIGVGFPPGWGEGHIIDLKPNDPRELQADMTFHLVPLLYEIGSWGVGMSETVRVTQDGCEVLTDYPRELVIV